MKTSILIAGVAALALAGTAAWAAGSNVHQMTVRLPGGGVEHIEYTGDVAPKISVAQVPFAAFPQIAFMPQVMFPNFARIQAAMNQQMAQMHTIMQNADAMAAQSFANMPNGTIAFRAGNIPGASSESFHMISMGAGKNFCAQSMQVTVAANGKQSVVRHSAGNCGPSGAAADHPAVSHKTAI
jgi:hypothetical protein